MSLPTCRIIRCLDLANGRVVKGVNFVDLKDAGDPVEIALQYNQQGADELVLLNITGGADNNQVIHQVLQQLKAQSDLHIIVGGAIRHLKIIQALIEAGADEVSIRSAAVHRHELVREAAQALGSERLVIAIDALRADEHSHPKSWVVCTQGGEQGTGFD